MKIFVKHNTKYNPVNKLFTRNLEREIKLEPRKILKNW